MYGKSIYRLCEKKDWDDALALGVYRGTELDVQDGYIHLSTAEQLIETAKIYFFGAKHLLLLHINPNNLGDELRWEKSRNGQIFPHFYGRLNTEFIHTITELELDDEGVHIFPKQNELNETTTVRKPTNPIVS